MYLSLSIFHLLVTLGLILVVLLQSGKGADIGAAFGGGSSQTVFGGRGAATFLSKVTSALAILFMLTSLTLTILASQRRSTSVIGTEGPPPAQSAPAQSSTPAPSPGQATPTTPGSAGPARPAPAAPTK
jgi:preprotein translocase subunit SecG